MAFTLTSSAFGEGAVIPQGYTCDGADKSPELIWDDAPSETRSFALIVHDPDAPKGDFTHWLLWDIPGNATRLAEDAGGASAGTAGRNSFGSVGYGGPCPPPGHGAHRYFFDLYALDVESLGLSHEAQRADVEAAIKGHVLSQAQQMGRYERK